MRDLCFTLDSNGQYFNIVPDKDNTMPEVLRAAIVLLFFSKNRTLRLFSGESIYGFIAKATNGITDYLSAQLAMLSAELKDLLLVSFPDIETVLLSHSLEDNTLTISISITNQTGDTLEQVIYTYDL